MRLKITDPYSAEKRQESYSRTKLQATRHQFPLLARLLISTLFIWAGINKILHPVATQEYMSAYGMPLTNLLLIGAIAVEILGGLSILLGIQARWGAIALALFLIPATLIFHTDFSDQIQQIMFFKNLAILGGLLMIIQYGAGNIILKLRR